MLSTQQVPDRLETILRIHIHLRASVPGNAVALAYPEVTSAHFDHSLNPPHPHLLLPLSR